MATPKSSPAARRRASISSAAAPIALSGHLAGIDDEGRLLFLPEGSTAAPVPLAIGIEISDGVLVKAARLQRRALAILTADPVPRWMLIGLVRDRVGNEARDARPGALQVVVDGESVRLAADHDLVLSCGQASLTLRYDGKVVISGTHIVSASRGPNRIKGASVAIN